MTQCPATRFLVDSLIPQWPPLEPEIRRAAVAKAVAYVSHARSKSPFYVEIVMWCGMLGLVCWMLLLSPGLFSPAERYKKAARPIRLFEGILPVTRAIVRLYRSTAFIGYFSEPEVIKAMEAHAGH